MRADGLLISHVLDIFSVYELKYVLSEARRQSPARFASCVASCSFFSLCFLLSLVAMEKF